MEPQVLDISPLFTGLTKPPMKFGVTLNYLCVISLIALCSFILFNSPLYAVSILPLYVFGWVACQIDYNIFNILFKRAHFAHAPNKTIWGCQSYEPF